VADWLEKEELQAVLARDWGFSIRSVEPVLTFDFLHFSIRMRYNNYNYGYHLMPI